MAEQPLRIEYVEARRVLLDVLTALDPHVDGVVRLNPPSSRHSAPTAY